MQSHAQVCRAKIIPARKPPVKSWTAQKHGPDAKQTALLRQACEGGTGFQPVAGVWTISGLKARDMTAWGEAQRAKPQVKVRKENPLRAESAGHRVEMKKPLFCFGLSGLEEFCDTGTGPPLATLAPARPVISRAFSPPFWLGETPTGGWKPVPLWPVGGRVCDVCDPCDSGQVHTNHPGWNVRELVSSTAVRRTDGDLVHSSARSTGPLLLIGDP
jgi:hypothetical protein